MTIHLHLKGNFLSLYILLYKNDSCYQVHFFLWLLAQMEDVLTLIHRGTEQKNKFTFVAFRSEKFNSGM